MNPEAVPRLRMFAGPNGSGKSTIKSLLPTKLLGVYVNPDEIEAEIKQKGFLDFDDFDIQANETETLKFFGDSVLLKNSGLALQAPKLRFDQNKLDFSDVAVNAYFASVTADFLRKKLVLARQSLTFETVMSSEDKINFFAATQAAGFRTYLYFVATENPRININRVKNRLRLGGHDVPVDKIKKRYDRSLNLLREAIKYANRSYIFDNSGEKAELIAEITAAKILEIKTESIPAWFKKYLLDKI